MTDPKLDRLKELLAEVDDLRRAATVLFWDQRVMMPPAGAQARADASATLRRAAREIFDALKRDLVPLIKEIADAGDVDASFLHGEFEPERQREFSLHVLGCFGFTDDEWRLDQTAHPFMCSPGAHDVRLTTNFRPNDLTSVFATMHEFGHGVN